ncbi:MAG: hypothetical protein KBC30_03410 [Planctomycetes bacterium]|jgi:hypothetical protein|nr:hypothetical protein [Planctomycetota bacterium]HON44427.1 hypothetical protein [Planctomycetota bacterium]HPY73913.1 hypothetical protein [Planctomycetota bacterium]HQA99536.1 hypothetical protein [Planctomycetota bacterium]HRU51198.1 hypothetical protein [Planctomycetota bacterium]
MAKAIPMLDMEWNLAVKVKSNLDLFNYLSSTLTSRQSLPADKVHPTEFFPKP